MSSANPRPRTQRAKGLARFLALSLVLGFVFTGMATPALAIASVFAADGINIAKTLPAYLSNVELQSISTLYGKVGDSYEPFASFYDKNRIPVTSDKISPLVKNAVIAVEDPNFYEHGGVDVAAIMRALLQNQLAGDTQSGASTITMQLVRNQLIEAGEWSNDQAQIEKAREQTAERKLLEMRLAIGVEQNYTKDQILTSYLNFSSFGGTVYGIESASQYYFNKPATDLTLPEAALLGGIFPAPNLYKPDDPANLDRAKARRDFVLDRMLQRGYINQEDHDAAVATPIEVHITPQSRGCEAATHSAQFFCDYVVNTIRNDSSFGETADDRLALLRRGGLQIYTSIDLNLQDQVQAEIDKHINRSDTIGAGSVVLQVGTNQILAMTENRNYTAGDNGGDTSKTAVNYMVDQAYGGSSGFQPGSTYKVFTLLDWLKTGHTLSENLVAPAPATLRNRDFADRCSPSGNAGNDTWKLENAANYRSSFDVRYATANSINTGFAAMAKKLDLCDIRDTAASFGVHKGDGSELDHEFTPNVIGSGSNSVSPLTMAGAYAGIANDGNYCPPVAITRVVESTGAERKINTGTCNQAVDASVARTATDALQGPFARGGTATYANPNDGSAIAGKTGSTDQYEQTWLIGYTTATVQATWLGNGSGTHIDLRSYRIKGEQANNVRYGLFKDIQGAIHAAYPGAPNFPAPDDASMSSKQIAVPDLAGKSTDEAQSTLEDLGFNVAINQEQVASTQPQGTVAATEPAAGTNVDTGSTVTIRISNGQTPQVGVPQVSGLSLTDAVNALNAAGFTTVRRSDGSDDLTQAGVTVTGVEPGEGSTVGLDTTITLQVSGQ